VASTPPVATSGSTLCDVCLTTSFIYDLHYLCFSIVTYAQDLRNLERSTCTVAELVQMRRLRQTRVQVTELVTYVLATLAHLDSHEDLVMQEASQVLRQQTWQTPPLLQ
jgi:hypothetical protein